MSDSVPDGQSDAEHLLGRISRAERAVYEAWACASNCSGPAAEVAFGACFDAWQALIAGVEKMKELP